MTKERTNIRTAEALLPFVAGLVSKQEPQIPVTSYLEHKFRRLLAAFGDMTSEPDLVSPIDIFVGVEWENINRAHSGATFSKHFIYFAYMIPWELVKQDMNNVSAVRAALILMSLLDDENADLLRVVHSDDGWRVESTKSCERTHGIRVTVMLPGQPPGDMSWALQDTRARADKAEFDAAFARDFKRDRVERF